MFAYGETATRLRAFITLDPYSGEETEKDWSTPYELAIPGCAFNPGQSSEPDQVGRNAVITQPEVYAPFGSDVLAGDRIVIRGQTFDVDGQPASWVNPFSGWAPGLVITLKGVEG